MLDGHYIHLLSNHFPIILSITGFFILTYGLFKHAKAVKQIGLAVLLAASIATIPAYITGEDAEEKVENATDTSKSMMEEHEEGAEFAFIFTDILGVFSLISLLLLMKDHKYSVMANRITWLVGLVTIATLFRVGQTGGQIRRPELRANTISDTTSIDNNKESEEDND